MNTVHLRKIDGGYIVEWFDKFRDARFVESYFPNLSSVLMWLSTYYDEPCGIYDLSQAKSDEEEK